MSRLSPTQFDVIARLIRSSEGPAREAARLVLVEGVKPGEAALRASCSPQSVSQAVRRIREAAALIESGWPPQRGGRLA